MCIQDTIYPFFFFFFFFEDGAYQQAWGFRATTIGGSNTPSCKKKDCKKPAIVRLKGCVPECARGLGETTPAHLCCLAWPVCVDKQGGQRAARLERGKVAVTEHTPQVGERLPQHGLSLPILGLVHQGLAEVLGLIHVC